MSAEGPDVGRDSHQRHTDSDNDFARGRDLARQREFDKRFDRERHPNPALRHQWFLLEIPSALVASASRALLVATVWNPAEADANPVPALGLVV
jgi:hypothetical protein